MSDYATHERGAYASPLRRLTAVLIDGLLVGAVMAAVLIPLWIAAQDRDDLIPIVLGAYLVLLAAAVLYEVAFVARRGATVGKHLMRIQVRGVDGELPSFGISFVRYFTKFLSAAVALLGLLWALWDPRRRGWHDMIAGTVVLHARRVTDAAAGLDRERDGAPDEAAPAQIAAARAGAPGVRDLVRARDASAGEASEARSDEQAGAEPSEPDFEVAPAEQHPAQAQAQPEPGEAAQRAADESVMQPRTGDSPAPAEEGEAARAAAGDMGGEVAEPIEAGQPIGQVESAEAVEVGEAAEPIGTGRPIDQVEPVEPHREPSQPATGPEDAQPAAATGPEDAQPAAATGPEDAQPAAAPEQAPPAGVVERPTDREPADDAFTAPEEPAPPAASAAQPSASGEPSAPVASAAADRPTPTEPAPAQGGAADPNLAAIADAQLAPESAGWLRQVAEQVDPRLDQVTAGWRALPQSEATRACVFGLLLGHLANTYPHMAADLSRAAERHVSFSTFGSGNRLAILQDIAADPAKIAAWIGPLIEVEDPEQVRRLLV